MYNIQKYSRSKFPDSNDGTFKFAEEVTRRFQPTHKAPIFRKVDSRTLLVVAKKLDFEGQLPAFLHLVQPYCRKDSRSDFNFVVVETGDEIDNQLHPFRDPTRGGNPNITLPYVTYGDHILVGDLDGLACEIERLVRGNCLIYSPNSEEPIKVFTKRDLERLKTRGLQPLTVTSIEELVKAIARYHTLFKGIYTSVTGRNRNYSGKVSITPRRGENLVWEGGDTIKRTVENIVGFGEDEEDYESIHYFGYDCWYLYNGKPQHRFTLTDSSVGFVVSRIEKAAPYGFYLRIGAGKDTENRLHSVKQLANHIRRAVGLSPERN